MYSTFIAPPADAIYKIGSYNGLPAIQSIECSGVGVLRGLDGGRVCAKCKELRAIRGSSNPGKPLGNWYLVISKCIERRNKEQLIKADEVEAKKFIQTPTVTLTLSGRALKEEAKAQVEYMKSMTRLDRDLRCVLVCIFINILIQCTNNSYIYLFLLSHSVKTYKKNDDESVPGMRVLFDKAAELCEKNPKMANSLVITLLKAAVAKEQFGRSAKYEEKAINFFRFLRTFDPKAAEVVSANLGGPSVRWMKTLDARERDDCILDSGKDGEKVVDRMKAAIERRDQTIILPFN